MGLKVNEKKTKFRALYDPPGKFWPKHISTSGA